MLASMSALPRAKNSLASVSTLCPRRRDRTWAISAQWPGGELRAGSVGPVLGGDLLAFGKVRGQGEQVVDVLGIEAVLEPVGAGSGELPGGLEREPLDLAPLRGEGDLLGAAAERHPQRLPAPRVHDGVAGVDRLVAGGVGIAVELVGAVAVAVVDHRLGGGVAHLGRGRGVGAVDRVPEGGHLLGEVELPGREQVDQGPVGREADRLVLVLRGALDGRTPQRAPKTGAQGPDVIGRPGVEDGRVDHADGPRGHRRPRGQRPDRLQQLLVPLQDHVVVHRRRVLLEGEQRGRVGQVARATARVRRRISGNLCFTRSPPLHGL
jgi:hypothetical protein